MNNVISLQQYKQQTNLIKIGSTIRWRDYDNEIITSVVEQITHNGEQLQQAEKEIWADILIYVDKGTMVVSGETVIEVKRIRSAQ
jgi:hypothetical protein